MPSMLDYDDLKKIERLIRGIVREEIDAALDRSITVFWITVGIAVCLYAADQAGWLSNIGGLILATLHKVIAPHSN